MDIQTFQLDEKASLKITIQSLLRNSLVELNEFLLFLEKNYLQILEVVIENLSNEFSKGEDFKYIEIDFSSDLLDKFIGLKESSIQKILSLLNYEKYKHYPVSEQIEVSVYDIIKARYFFICYLTNSLTFVMSSDEAIDVIKQFVDHWIKSYENPENYTNTMKEYLENSWLSFFKNWKTHDAVIGMPDEHTVICKITKCRWHEIMKDLDFNPEVLFATICYSDFQQRKISNPGFQLTRTKTLVQGDEMCDFCDHDTRNKEEIDHPSQEIWESL